MARVRVLVLRAAGVNCELETAHAWRQVGADADIVHVNALRTDPAVLDCYQILTVPGGFSYGDDVSAGRIFANQIELFLGDTLRHFLDRDRLVLGICNGFQVLCKAGLLPGGDCPAVTITENVSGKYEDRWVQLGVGSDACKFLEPGQHYVLPVAHGEGRVMVRHTADLDALAAGGCIAVRYLSDNGRPADFPADPNGSMGDIAGLCDPSGRVFGLMPHPERFMHVTQHPEWTGGRIEQADGLTLFASAVGYLG